MPDRYGALAIPTTAPLSGEAAGDPLLGYLLDFLKAFLLTDANVTTAWSPVGGSEPVVRTLFPHNPADLWFDDSQVPALFAWRNEILPARRIAADWRVRDSIIHVMWVFPPTKQDIQRQRVAFPNALHAGIDLALERGRTPSYVIDNETQATYLGSLIYDQLGVMSIEAGRARWVPLIIESKDNLPMSRVPYSALLVEVTVREKLTLDLTLYDILDGGVTATMTGGSTPIQTESGDFVLRVASVSPNTGTSAGGTNVTITGSNFQTGATVTLGGTACTNVTVVSFTTITCTTPAHAVGAVACNVTNPSAESTTLSNAFTYT